MLQYLDTMIAFVAVMLGVSILVTALTQMINSTLGMRGRSLLWGLETLLKQADPNFKEHAREIADKILKHPLLSHTGRRRATAIRKEEFIPLLEEIISQPPAKSTAAESHAKGIAGATGNPASIQAKLKPEHYIKEIEHWFDTVMDRVSERFALRSRWASVAISILLAFALHLDAISLLEKLFTDTELRSSLVQSTSAIRDRADEIFTLSSNAYTDAVVALQLSQKENRLLANPPAFVSAGQAENWIRAQISDSVRAESLITEYEAQLQSILKQRTGQLASAVDSLRIDFNKTRFVLVPIPYPGLQYNPREVAGILIASTLLSLGAPFWYNVLKNLASLRPKVAGLVQKEARQPKSDVTET